MPTHSSLSLSSLCVTGRACVSLLIGEWGGRVSIPIGAMSEVLVLLRYLFEDVGRTGIFF
jgi:hypothetical protein